MLYTITSKFKIKNAKTGKIQDEERTQTDVDLDSRKQGIQWHKDKIERIYGLRLVGNITTTVKKV